MAVLFADSLFLDVKSDKFDHIFVNPGLSLESCIKDFEIYKDDFSKAFQKKLVISLGTNDELLDFEFRDKARELVKKLEKIGHLALYWLVPRKYATSEEIQDATIFNGDNILFLDFFDGDKDDVKYLEEDLIHLNPKGKEELLDFIIGNLDLPIQY